MSAFSSYITYALTYIISTSILVLYQKINSKTIKFGNSQYCLKIIKIILIIFACIPVVMLATFRKGIGTDFDAFFYEYQWCAKNVVSYEQLLQASVNFNDEVGLLFLMKAGKMLFGSFQGFLFLASILTIGPVIVAFIMYDSKNVAFCFLIYLLTLFPSSFNGIHQHIAVALSLLAIVLAYKERFITSVIMILIAFFFHKTALVTFAFLICLKIFKRYPTLKLSVIVMIACFSLIGYKNLIQLVLNIPLLGKYSYAFNENYIYSINYLIMHSVLKIPLLFIMIVFYTTILKSDRKNTALVCYTVIDFLGIFLAFYIRWAMRLQYYTLAVAPLLILNISNAFNKHLKKKEAFLIKFLMIAVYIFRFIVLFGLYRYDEIIPYSFITIFM